MYIKFYLKLTMKPKHDFIEASNKIERLELDNIAASLSMEQREEIVQSGIELQNAQEKPQDPNILPTLEIEDISKDAIVSTINESTYIGSSPAVPLGKCTSIQ